MLACICVCVYVCVVFSSRFWAHSQLGLLLWRDTRQEADIKEWGDRLWGTQEPRQESPTTSEVIVSAYRHPQWQESYHSVELIVVPRWWPQVWRAFQDRNLITGVSPWLNFCLLHVCKLGWQEHSKYSSETTCLPTIQHSGNKKQKRRQLILHLFLCNVKRIALFYCLRIDWSIVWSFSTNTKAVRVKYLIQLIWCGILI